MNNPRKSPHKIFLKISHAENISTNSDKTKKSCNKWKVIILGGKKKCTTNYSFCEGGNPTWKCELSLKLTKAQTHPLVLVVEDIYGGVVGQIEIPITEIKPGNLSWDSTGSSVERLQCSKLEGSCNSTGPSRYLFYRIWVQEYYRDDIFPNQGQATKRHSIFGFKMDSHVASGSQLAFDHLNKFKAHKRHSIFKSNETLGNLKFRKGKAKSLANIHTMDDIEQSQSSDSEIEDHKSYFPPDHIYDQVTQDLGLTRVGDILKNKAELHKDCTYRISDLEEVMISSIHSHHNTINESQFEILTLENADPQFPDISSLDEVLDQYEDVPSSAIQECSHKQNNSPVYSKKETSTEICPGKCERQKYSDYGSQGSIYSNHVLGVSRNEQEIKMSKTELLEEVNSLRKELEGLQVKLHNLECSTTSQMTTLQSQMKARDLEIASISQSLCKLRMKLLEDGLTKYLELS